MEASVCVRYCSREEETVVEVEAVERGIDNWQMEVEVKAIINRNYQ